VLDGSPEVLRDVAIVAKFGTQSAIIMAALRSRCGHYIFALWFLLSFPRLISAVAHWMSTILPHMAYVALVRI